MGASTTSTIKSKAKKNKRKKTLPEPKAVAISANGYNSAFSWREKARFIISHSAKPVTLGQIADAVVDFENRSDRERVIRGLSTVLTPANISDDVKIIRREKGRRAFTMSSN